MSNDAESFDHGAPASPAEASTGSGLALDAGADFFADIGYEAADPSLQAPLWRAAMPGLSTARDRR